MLWPPFLCATTSLVQALPTIGSINETSLLGALLSGTGVGPGAAGTFTGGATGGIQLPTADIEKGTAISIDRSELEIARTPSIRVLKGWKGFEIGAGYEDIKANGELFDVGISDITLSVWNVNAKYALPIKTSDTAIALGANYNFFNIGGLVPNIKTTNIYLAGTKPVGSDSKISANVTYTSVAMNDTTLEKKNDFAFGLGYEKSFENGTVAGAELILSAGELLSDSASSTNYANVYVNMPINEMLTGRVAFVGMGKFTTANFGVTLGL